MVSELLSWPGDLSPFLLLANQSLADSVYSGVFGILLYILTTLYIYKRFFYFVSLIISFSILFYYILLIYLFFFSKFSMIMLLLQEWYSAGGFPRIVGGGTKSPT